MYARNYKYESAGMQVLRRKFNKLCRLAICCHCSSRVTRYHMVHCGKENKGTFNESGYICPAESILPWCIPRSSLQVFYTFLITVTCVRRATSACRVKKGIKLLENAVQRAHRHAVQKERKQRITLNNIEVRWLKLSFVRSQRIFLSSYLSRRRRSCREKKRSQIVCDCVTLGLMTNR